jgi:hypothetical protein
MADDEEFDHQITPWTAGQLRKALEGVPDDFVIRVWIAEDPGGDTVDEQAVIEAGPWSSHGEGAPPDYFAIGCEFPSGRYYRRRG